MVVKKVSFPWFSSPSSHLFLNAHFILSSVEGRQEEGRTSARCYRAEDPKGQEGGRPTDYKEAQELLDRYVLIYSTF